MAWEIIFTLLLGTLCFSNGMRLGRLMLRKGATADDLFKGNRWFVLLAIGLYSGLVILAVSLPQWQGLPLVWRVYGMRTSWTIIRVLLLGACGLGWVICWRTARAQLSFVLIVGCLGLFSFSVAEGYFLAPIYGQLHNDLQPNGIYRQTSDSSCAPAALATLLRWWGVATATEVKAAQLANTSRMGTTMPQLIQAAQEFGMDGVELSPTWDQILQVNRPGILSVWLIDQFRKLPHAVTLMAMDKDQAIIADPSTGKYYRLTRAEFNQIWRQEYVPIFPLGEDISTPLPTLNTLKRLGYSSHTLGQAVQVFQQDWGLKPTGTLDAMTSLMVTGPFLQHQPTLNVRQFEQQVMARMGCSDRPDTCPW
jgi:predicted double-glycine peptidase